MNKLKTMALASLLLLVACGGDDSKAVEQPTMQGLNWAEGAGAVATGGNGGTTYMVTSLDDDVNTPGTLRYALNQQVSRTIIFKVAGIINLKSELRIKRGNVTILGQSAPGDGICLKGYPVVIEADNVIVRFIRFRMGDEHAVEGDALTCIGCDKVMIDHCSMSWSTDECASCYGNTNFTMQFCVISESLRCSVHGKGTHGYGGIWGGTNVTFHHNLLAHHDSRNPRFDHDYVSKQRGPLDYVNNVVYNWGGNNSYGGESTAAGNTTYRTINMVNNYYKAGPASSHKDRLLNPTASCSNCNGSDASAVLPGHFYLSGNYLAGYPAITADNWSGVQGVSASVLESIKSAKRFDMVSIATLQTAEDAYETVLSNAGASLVRDAIDTRVVNEARNGNYTCNGSNGSKNGLIDTPADAGGWPAYGYNAALVPTDVDNDGIPDEWEDAHGLNKNNSLDGKSKTLNSNYTNLEMYLNTLVAHLYY